MIEIPLTKGFVVIVDNEDSDLANSNWIAKVDRSGRVYAARNVFRTVGSQMEVKMHRIILQRTIDFPLKSTDLCDHIDRNALNNTRSNLRVATFSQNTINQGLKRTNKTGYKGVSQDAASGYFIAQIQANKKKMVIGRFLTAEDAAVAYNHVAAKEHGEFAFLNEVPNWENIFPERIKRGWVNPDSHERDEDKNLNQLLEDVNS